MKSFKKLFWIGLCFSINVFTYGQFNTLTPTLPKKTENPPISQKAEETKDVKQQNGKKFWRQIFNMTSKADLKKELDSLKRWIKENSDKNKKKWDVQKVKDSLILNLQSQHIINEQKRYAFPMKNDFEKKTEEIKSINISMPLLKNVDVTSPYGMRIHPISGIVKMHNGIDLKAYYENVYAVMDGIVTAAGWDPKGGGNYIKIKHYNRFETAYLHLSEIYYKVGELVKAGYVIAKSGNSGNSTGAHLHFAVKESGRSINPTHFLNHLVQAKHLLTASYQN